MKSNNKNQGSLFHFDGEEIVRKTISLIVLNEHGLLARVSSLFAGRGYNIESLTVSSIPGTEYSRMTILTESKRTTIDQIVRQLDKLIPVSKVIEDNLIEKEMVLVKFDRSKSSLSDIQVLCSTYSGKVVNISHENIIAMVIDDAIKVQNFIDVVDSYKPLEVVRGGSVAIEQ